MNRTTVLAAMLVAIASVSAATAQERIWFSFDKPEAAKPWQTVNDGVMGGRSVGNVKVNEDNKLEFSGFKVGCEETYQHHLQGVYADQHAIYWCFTTTLVKRICKAAC